MKAMGLQQDGKTGVPVWHKSENRKKVPVFREKRDRKGEKSMLSESIKKLVQYGVESGITPECERIYATIFFWMPLGKANIQNRRQSMLKSILRRL